jgi:hypothetical protein
MESGRHSNYASNYRLQEPKMMRLRFWSNIRVTLSIGYQKHSRNISAISCCIYNASYMGYNFFWCVQIHFKRNCAFWSGNNIVRTWVK